MIVSIDIGNSNVKIVQSQFKGEELHIMKVGSKFIEHNSKKMPESVEASQFVATISDLCKELGINPKKIKNAISGLTGKQVSIKQLTTLEMSDQELSDSLEFEARKHIPLDGTG